MTPLGPPLSWFMCRSRAPSLRASSGTNRERITRLLLELLRIDSHSRDARRGGESERRIWALTAWRDAPFFSDRERAALALTEAMTRLPENGVPDDVYDEAARYFPEQELGNLIGAIIAINAWNRVGVGTAMAPPAEVDEAAA